MAFEIITSSYTEILTQKVNTYVLYVFESLLKWLISLSKKIEGESKNIRDEDYCTFSQLFLLDFFLFLINIVGCDPKEMCNICLKEIHFKTCLIFEIKIVK